MLGVGVLRLVDEDVIEPAVELEQHPGRDAVAAQQFERGRHEIVVIELGMQPLAPPVGVEQRAGEADDGAGRLEDRQPVARLEETEGALRLAAENRVQIAARRRRRFGIQALLYLAFVGQEGGVEILVEQRFAAVRVLAPSGNLTRPRG